jgi:predicted acylesterase/phospholipase RssA
MKYLILGSGGMVGFRMLGVMAKLQEQGQLRDLEEISGSSIGSILGFFYIVHQGNMEKLVEDSFSFDLKKYAKPNIKNLITKFGFIETDPIKDELLRIVGRDFTFRELYEFNPIKLHINTFDIMSRRTVYMSIDTAPDLSVLTAIIRSISICIVFVPQITKNEIFIDGSTYEYVPATPFLQFAPEQVLELRLVPDQSSTVSTKPSSFMKYIILLVTSLLDLRKIFDHFKRIEIPSTNYEILDFGMSASDKMKMYIEGYSQNSIF